MTKKSISSFVILVLQGVTMAAVAISPLLEHGFNLSLPYNLRAVQYFGFAICAVGLVLGLYALKVMGPSLEVFPEPKESAQLIQNWPFSMVRNPAYLALLISGIGWSLAFLSLWTAVAVVAMYLVLAKKISLEESFLELKFGEHYKQYCKKVPRLFPAARKTQTPTKNDG